MGENSRHGQLESASWGSCWRRPCGCCRLVRARGPLWPRQTAVGPPGAGRKGGRGRSAPRPRQLTEPSRVATPPGALCRTARRNSWRACAIVSMSTLSVRADGEAAAVRAACVLLGIVAARRAHRIRPARPETSCYQQIQAQQRPSTSPHRLKIKLVRSRFARAPIGRPHAGTRRPGPAHAARRGSPRRL
jgi:hypothetical protein